jgi:hypothetical protein
MATVSYMWLRASVFSLGPDNRMGGYDVDNAR